MSDNNVWNSDFGAVFKQRYDILKGIDIKKGIGGAAGGAIGHVIDPTGIIGPAIGGGLGAELDKSEKMEKERTKPIEDEEAEISYEEKEVEPKKAKYMSNEYNRLNPINDRPRGTRYNYGSSLPPNRPEIIGQKTNTYMTNSLRKAINSVTKMLQKLDSCGGSTAGLNVKHVTAKKEGGGVYPAKAPPKPKMKRA